MIELHIKDEALEYEEEIDISLYGPKRDARPSITLGDGTLFTAEAHDVMMLIKNHIKTDKIIRVMSFGAYDITRCAAPLSARPHFTYPHANEYGVKNIDGNKGALMPSQLRFIFNTYSAVDLLVSNSFVANPMRTFVSEIVALAAPFVLSPRRAFIKMPGTLCHMVVGIIYISMHYWDIEFVQLQHGEIWSVWKCKTARPLTGRLREIKKLLNILETLDSNNILYCSPVSRYAHMMDIYKALADKLINLYTKGTIDSSETN